MNTYVTARAMASDLARIRTWIFDLDNTLYHPRLDLFAQIDVRMTDYIARLLGVDAVEAHRVQKGFFHEHGTTLAGLMRHHHVEPREFLDYVHDVDLTHIVPDAVVADGIARLPGRKLVFTNGDVDYAGRVLGALGLGETFEAVHDIHACAYVPKPEPGPYAALCETYGIDPTTALFVEDMARNLKPAKALGMTTVWINNGSERGGHEASSDYIDIEIADLGDWLQSLDERLAA